MVPFCVSLNFTHCVGLCSIGLGLVGHFVCRLGPGPINLTHVQLWVNESPLDTRRLPSDAWFPPFRCRSAAAVSPLPLREFRKNYVSAVRITLPT